MILSVVPKAPVSQAPCEVMCPESLLAAPDYVQHKPAVSLPGATRLAAPKASLTCPAQVAPAIGWSRPPPTALFALPF